MAAVFSAGTHTDKQMFQKSHTCQHTVCFKPKANTKKKVAPNMFLNKSPVKWYVKIMLSNIASLNPYDW